MEFTDSILQIFSFQMLIAAEVKQLLFATFAGLLIGTERGLAGKSASYRTFAIITIGSCVYTLLSVQGANDIANTNIHYDVTRIAAQIVTGIGFVGAGVIFKIGDKIEGVTTAAMIWLAASVGMACGFNKIGMVCTIMIIFCCLEFALFLSRRIAKKRRG